MSFSARKVSSVVRELLTGSRMSTQKKWLAAVCARCVAHRPDLASSIKEWVGTPPAQDNVLEGLSIGEVGACYEALLALTDRQSRKDAGQFFTPDDAAEFMARQSLSFPTGRWIDPACGVGNLSWHLVRVQTDPASFVANNLILVDKDGTALKTAVALIAAEFIAPDDLEAWQVFSRRALKADYLKSRKIPSFNYAILNPPYARAGAYTGYLTATTRDYFAFFLERVSRDASGMIAVTPASYLSVPKYNVLREILGERFIGGDVFVFDNVPDTLFRGYKYGSSNTSSTNFVRAAITVCKPQSQGWRITPIVRWQAHVRTQMWEQISSLLSPRRIGPFGEWMKTLPQCEAVWDRIFEAPHTIGDLVCPRKTPFRLDVALTPRYYISAAFRSLDRGTKATLFFPDEASRDLAALILNSSLPYLWWRALDGGVTFPKRLLMSTPIPEASAPPSDVIRRLREEEPAGIVVKMNAGRMNENVKHTDELRALVDSIVLPDLEQWQRVLLYSHSMFPLPAEVCDSHSRSALAET